MKTLQDTACRLEIVQRMGTLSADSPREWGKMRSKRA